jgi:hypothetical protein
MNDTCDLFNKTQKNRVHFLNKFAQILPYEKQLEISKDLKSLTDNYKEYEEKLRSLPKDSKYSTLKLEFDITNAYTKKGNAVLNQISNSVQQEIKRKDSDL